MNCFQTPVSVCVTILLSSIFFFIIDNSYASDQFEELDIALKNYDKRQRPFRNISPVEVKVQMYISSLGPVSTKTFTFETEFYLRQWWNDPRINFTQGSISINGNPKSFLWVPDLFILNSHGTEMFEMVTETVRTEISFDGNVFMSAGFKAISSCNMDLQKYPMDSQTCSITFESYAFKNVHLNPVWNEKPLEYDKKSIKVPGFTVSNITTQVLIKTYSSGDIFPNLQVSFHLDRTFPYYLYRSYVPSFFLVILSWGTFQIPATAYPARVTLIITNFLANAFILQHASSEYTKVEYTTAIEIYLLVNICFIMITMVEYMFVVRTDPDDNMAWCISCESKLNTKAVRGKSYNVEKTNSTYCSDDVNKELDPTADVPCDSSVPEEVQSLKAASETKVPKLHKIDRISRVLIPILYIIFNIAYFAYYFSMS